MDLELIAPCGKDAERAWLSFYIPCALGTDGVVHRPEIPRGRCLHALGKRNLSLPASRQGSKGDHRGAAG